MRAIPGLAAGALALLVQACVTTVPVPDVSLEGVDPDRSWERALEACVDERGCIDFDRLATSSKHDLEVWVRWVADVGPDSRVGTDQHLAALINAYNGLAMYNVLHAGVLPEDKVRFFYLRHLVVGGEPISLVALENDVIRPLGEPRIHFALNCMVRGCPRLPRQPFRAAELDAQLEAATREFANDPRHVEVRHDERRVLLSAILDWYEEDFLAVAPSLVAYLNRYRDEPIPEDYEVGLLDYDWTLNAAPRSAP